MELQYAIVEFMDGESVAVLATNWILKDSNCELCYWPPQSKSKCLEKMAKEQHEPAPASGWTNPCHAHIWYIVLLSCSLLLDSLFACF